jgi:conjugal transfer pilus assembly protein TraA
MKLMKLNPMLALMAVLMALFAGAVTAGTTGTEFQSFFQLMLDWTTGYLGKAIALAAFLFGAGIGMAKQNVVPAIIGIAFAIVFTVGPNVINGMMTAVI